MVSFSGLAAPLGNSALFVYKLLFYNPSEVDGPQRPQATSAEASINSADQVQLAETIYEFAVPIPHLNCEEALSSKELERQANASVKKRMQDLLYPVRLVGFPFEQLVLELSPSFEVGGRFGTGIRINTNQNVSLAFLRQNLLSNNPYSAAANHRFLAAIYERFYADPLLDRIAVVVDVQTGGQLRLDSLRLIELAKGEQGSPLQTVSSPRIDSRRWSTLLYLAIERS